MFGGSKEQDPPYVVVWHHHWLLESVMARPRRLQTGTYLGEVRYFLTFSTAGRRPVFRDDDLASSTLRHFRITAVEEQFAVLAYCLMPDHAHLLVEGQTATSDLRRFVKMAKQRSGGAHSRRYHRPLWQEGYFDRVLRDPDDAAQIAQYIVMNPVRAGLVTEPCDYPYVGTQLFDMTKGFSVSRVLFFGPGA